MHSSSGLPDKHLSHFVAPGSRLKKLEHGLSLFRTTGKVGCARCVQRSQNNIGCFVTGTGEENDLNKVTLVSSNRVFPMEKNKIHLCRESNLSFNNGRGPVCFVFSGFSQQPRKRGRGPNQIRGRPVKREDAAEPARSKGGRCFSAKHVKGQMQDSES